MNEITRDEYIKALDVVEAYHIQLKLKQCGRVEKAMSEVGIGDDVRCVCVYHQYRNCLTKDKLYRVFNVRNKDMGIYRFGIRDDNGKIKYYDISNSQFRAVI